MSTASNIVFGLGVLLAVLGSSLLVAFGLNYLKPYLQIRSMEEGTCVVSHVHLLEDLLVTCRCGRDSTSGCLSRYPCLKISVNFTADYTGFWKNKEDDYFAMTNVTLYDSFETYNLQKDKRQCSFHKCDRMEKKNLDAVMNFLERFGELGTTFMCFYEPAEPNFAIVNAVTFWTVVHTILWPSLAVIAGVSILVAYLFCARHSSRDSFPTSSLDRVKNLNRDNRYERVAIVTDS